ncbi:TPA: porin, partial [Pseudomonas putida]|nr:porin [Pseudomonas putida]
KADQANNDLKASGYYAQMAYTLTGEPRIYKFDGAKFDTIKPENKELGAWEVFYRFDDIKVEDGNLVTAVDQSNERKAKSHTVGVNWYVNEAVKVSANYINVRTDNNENTVGDDSGNAIVTRLQYVF